MVFLYQDLVLRAYLVLVVTVVGLARDGTHNCGYESVKPTGVLTRFLQYLFIDYNNMITSMALALQPSVSRSV